MILPAVLGRAAALLFAAFFVLALAAERTLAQDPELEARVQQLHANYIAAVTTGDQDAFVALFTDDAVIMPGFGGTFEGTQGVERFFEESGPVESLEIRSELVERIGDVILDIGSFQATFPPEADVPELEGEYVVLSREENDELLIHRFVYFAPRQPPVPQ
jgi:uncharacterized protein (TIGR02246 family)